MVVSRLKEEDVRRVLQTEGDGWEKGPTFDNEVQALAALDWLKQRNWLREYKLFKVEKTTTTTVDPLNDQLPWVP